MSDVSYDSSVLRRLTGASNRLAGLTVKVGILEDKNARTPDPETGEDLTNAEIGAKHEFGVGLPIRSFIRMPLVLKLPERLAAQGSTRWVENLAENGANHTAALLGVEGEDVIQEAFDTGGFGTWKRLSPVTIANKGSSAILIDSAQMRQAISSAVQ